MSHDDYMDKPRPLVKVCPYCKSEILRNLALCPVCDKLQSEDEAPKDHTGHD